MRRRVKPTPAALLLRELMITHTCQTITEQGAKNRVRRLDDTNLQRCAWCGTWADAPTCARCTSTHLIGETL